MSMFVKIVRMPGEVKEIAVDGGASVGQALEIAEMSASSSEKITVNGSVATLSTCLSDGDRIVLARDAKSA